MRKLIINSAKDFLNNIGQEIGASDWFEVNQKVIDSFADSTYDHQWVHVDLEKARKESPFKCTIAHGYLLLALIPYFLDRVLSVCNLKYIINYSIKDMVFKKAVPSNSKVRLVAKVNKARDICGICKVEIGCCIEILGQEEVAAEGTIVYLYYFNDN